MGAAKGGRTPQGSVRLDATGRETHASLTSARVRAPDSGNAHAVRTSSGGGTSVDVHPAPAPCWLLDDRLEAPDGEGPNTRAHGRAMRTTVVSPQPRLWQAVRMEPG